MNGGVGAGPGARVSAAHPRRGRASLAFQNCHRLALFNPAAVAEHEEFVTPRSQSLNQRPELVNC